MKLADTFPWLRQPPASPPVAPVQQTEAQERPGDGREPSQENEEPEIPPPDSVAAPFHDPFPDLLAAPFHDDARKEALWPCPHCGRDAVIDDVFLSLDRERTLTLWRCDPCGVVAVTPNGVRQPPTG